MRRSLSSIFLGQTIKKKGFETALMTHERKHCFEHGFAELFVEAEADDTNAIALYRKTRSVSEMKVVQFSCK
jgi:ribosomal protein S18 acetylase RimI-like enzyme